MAGGKHIRASFRRCLVGSEAPTQGGGRKILLNPAIAGKEKGSKGEGTLSGRNGRST